MTFHVDELKMVEVSIKVNVSDFEFERILGREKLILMLQKGCRVLSFDTMLNSRLSLIYSPSAKEVEDRVEEKSLSVIILAELKDKDVLNNILIEVKDILRSYKSIMSSEVKMSLRSS